MGYLAGFRMAFSRSARRVQWGGGNRFQLSVQSQASSAGRRVVLGTK